MLYATSVTSQSVNVQFVDDDGIGVAAPTAGTLINWQRQGANDVATFATVDLLNPDSAWQSGGVYDFGGGHCRLDVPNTIFSTAGKVKLFYENTDMHLVVGMIEVGATATAAEIATALAGSVVHVTSPTAPGGRTQLLTLATYSSATGQRLAFPLPSTAPDAAGGATCVFKVLDATSGSYVLELTGPITGAAGSQTGYITITTTNANLLTRGKEYRYRAFASYSGDLLPIAANTIRRDD